MAVSATAVLLVSIGLAEHFGRQRATAAIIEAAAALQYRSTVSRVVGLPYRPLQPETRQARTEVIAPPGQWQLLAAAARANDLATKAPSPASIRAEGIGHLLVGDRDAATLLESAVEIQNNEVTATAAIRKSVDAGLLTDLSAAEYVRAVEHDDGSSLLLAIEAGERAWRLGPTPESGWNRALAIERLGTVRAAGRAWSDYLAVDPSREWKSEAKERIRRLQERSTTAPPDVALLAWREAPTASRIPLQIAEQFFEEELIATANDPGHLAELRRVADRILSTSGDRLPLDAATAMSRSPSERAFHVYARGVSAFDQRDMGSAQTAFAEADALLASDHNPFHLVARFQQIRTECTQAAPSCLSEVRSFRQLLPPSSGYAWLSARSAAVEGQALWNVARVYEAVSCFEQALHGFERLHDDDGAGWTHMLLANALATAGESDLSLDHQMTSLRWSMSPSDARKRQVFEESALLFLRRDALASATLMIDELGGILGTAASRVFQLTIEGLLQARQGDPATASLDFNRARRLLPDTGEGDRWDPLESTCRHASLSIL